MDTGDSNTQLYALIWRDNQMDFNYYNDYQRLCFTLLVLSIDLSL